MLHRLLEHNRWATAQLLEQCRSLSDEQLDQAFDIGHRTLGATFDHYIPNVALWAGLMAGPLGGQPRGDCSLIAPPSSTAPPTAPTEYVRRATGVSGKFSWFSCSNCDQEPLRLMAIS